MMLYGCNDFLLLVSRTLCNPDRSGVYLQCYRVYAAVYLCHTLVPCDLGRGRVTSGTPGGVPISIDCAYLKIRWFCENDQLFKAHPASALHISMGYL